MPYTYIGVNNGNGWKNLPSRETPRNAANFNIMENGIKGAYQGLNELDSKIDREVDAINQDISAINQDISAVNARVDMLESMTDLAVIDTQSGSFVQSTVADDCVAEVTIEGKTVVTPADPLQDISPDNPATIRSVGDSPFDVVATGKNLFDATKAPQPTDYSPGNVKASGIGYIKLQITNPGPNSVYRAYYTKELFKVGKTYTVSCDAVSGGANLIDYAIGSMDKGTDIWRDSSKTVTVRADRDYFLVFWLNRSNSTLTGTYTAEFFNIQLEENTVATPYEPYKSNKITISSFSGRSLPNGVCDKLELLANGKRRDIQNVCIAVFDGSNDENWVLGPSQPNDLTLARFCYNNQNIAMGSKVISDRFEFESSNYWQENRWHLITKECIAPHAETGQINIIIKKSRIQGWSDDLSNSEKIALFKAWLATNHITVLYALATPIITESKYTPLTTYKGTTNILTTSQLQPTLAAKFYSRLGNSTEVIMARLDQLTQALLALGGTV